jgi:hypothetical protein
MMGTRVVERGLTPLPAQDAAVARALAVMAVANGAAAAWSR